jgi:hypothetical protein
MEIFQAVSPIDFRRCSWFSPSSYGTVVIFEQQKSRISGKKRKTIWISTSNVSPKFSGFPNLRRFFTKVSPSRKPPEAWGLPGEVHHFDPLDSPKWSDLDLRLSLGSTAGATTRGSSPWRKRGKRDETLCLYSAYVYMYTYVYIYIFMYVYIYICIHVYMYIYIIICIYVCIIVYIYVCTNPKRDGLERFFLLKYNGKLFSMSFWHYTGISWGFSF